MIKKFIHAAMMAITYNFIPLLMMNGMVFIVGAFITQDLDPRNWFLLAAQEGRMAFVGLQVIFLNLRSEFWKKFK